MSEKAIATDEASGVPLYPVDEIYSDHEFNCREDIANPTDSISLARSIAQNGLIQPIVIRPSGEQAGDPENYKYVIVAGYRRYQAYRVNNHPVIPAVLRGGETHRENKVTNLVENLERKNLNLLEEALGLQSFYESGWSRKEIAEKLGVSEGWVQTRCMILELEPEVQQEFAAGNLVSQHIRPLYTQRENRDIQLEMARSLKAARQRGDKSENTLNKILSKGSKPKATSKKRRSSREMEDMMEHIYGVFGTYGFAGRALAWAAGNIANYEFYQDIRDQASEVGIPYQIPELEL